MKRSVKVLFGACLSILFAQAVQGLADSPAGKSGASYTPRIYGPQDPVMAGARSILQGTVNNPAADTTPRDTQSSTSLVSLGDGRLVIAFNDSGSFEGAYQRQSGYAFSANNGASWSDGGTVPPVNGVTFFISPALAADPVAKLVYMATASTFAGKGLPVYRSSTGGQSWNAKAADGTGGTFAARQAFYPAIAVDAAAGSGQGNVFVCVLDNDNGHIYFTRSTNKGGSFTPAAGLDLGATSSVSCAVAVGPQHDVYVFTVQKPGAVHQLVMRRSTNRGVSFGPPVVVGNLLTPNTFASLALAGGMFNNFLPQVAINPDPLKPYLYVVYNDSPNAVSGPDNGNIYLVYSKDRGATWSAPVAVDASANDQFMPAIGFASKGNLMVTYNSRSQDTANSSFHRRARIGKLNSTGGVAFNPSFQLGPNTPNLQGQDAFAGLGHFENGYKDQVIGSGGKWMTSWADSRTGNAFHARQPDVRFAAIAAPVPSANLGVSVSTSSVIMTPLDARVIRARLTAAGGPANDVFLNVTAPKGMKIEPPGGLDCTVNGSFMGCSLGSIASGGARNVYFKVTADGTSGVRTVSAQVSTSSRDTTQSNNAASLAFAVLTGAGVTASYTTGNLAIPIPDVATTDVPIAVPDGGQVLDVKVAVRFDHSFDADVDMYLRDPAGQIVELSTDNGAGNDNYGSGANDCSGTPTVFDDDGPVAIGAGSPPFAGTYTPEAALAGFLGKPVDGNWILRIVDDTGGDAGIVGCVSLTITRKP
jgi:subtilisin-like proprotein convertase family protein